MTSQRAGGALTFTDGRTTRNGCWLGLALAVGLISPVQADLVAHYAFDSAATLLDDSSIGMRTLSSTGPAPTLRTGSFGQAVDLGGSTWLWNASDQFNFGVDDFAVSFWYLHDGFGFSNGQIITKTQTSSDLGWDIFKTTSGGIDTLSAVIDDPAGEHRVNSTSPADDATNFHHVVVQRVADNLDVYVDGSIVGSTVGVDSRTVDSVNAFAIGARNVNSSGNGGEFAFDGAIDEVWVFNQALNNTEIQDLFNSNTNSQSGIPEPSVLQLHINRFTGETRIEGFSGSSPFNLDRYTMESFPLATNRENIWVPANWNSLTAQAQPGWAEVAPTPPATSQQVLSEENLSGSIPISGGQSVSLGTVYDATQGLRSTLFSYSAAGDSADINGTVIFEGEGLRLRVVKSSGRTSIFNPESAGLDIESYAITSPDSDLNATSWSSLADQSIPGWTESNPTAASLIELNLSSSTVLSGDDSFELGSAYAGGNGGTENLEFEFNMVGAGGIFDGPVEYVILGDMDGDGTVDTADAPLLVQALTNRAAYDGQNLTTSAGFLVDADAYGDINGDGRFDLGDMAAFNSALSGAASATAVPEPSSLCLAAFWLITCIGIRRTRLTSESCRSL